MNGQVRPYCHKTLLSMVFALVLEKQPIKTLSPKYKVFWLDDFGAPVWNSNTKVLWLWSLTFALLQSLTTLVVKWLGSSSVEDHLSEPQSGKTKDYKFIICCLSAKHTAARSKSKDWVAQNQNNVSWWSNMSTCGLLFQWASSIKSQLSMLI